jgi:hypothetical protein
MALAQAAVRSEALPITTTFGIESIRLPAGERMGLASGSLLFEIGDGWKAGPAIYGAASGHRGGFFVGGLELQHRWMLGQGISLATGLFAGGGGGAAAPVGGGLMLRPAATLWKDIGPALQLGLSWSSVRFPSGQINSSQVGVALAWRDEFIHLVDADMPSHSDSNSSSVRPTGLGFNRIAATATSYRIDDAGSHRHIGLAGARAESNSSIDGLSCGFEGAAAAKGDAAGYMELLGSASISLAPLSSIAPGWRVGARLGAGLAGGGNVPTGGGLIGKASLMSEWRVASGWTIGADVGTVRAASGPLRATQAQVWLGMDLEPRRDARSNAGHEFIVASSVVRTEWVGVLQHLGRVERRDGSSDPLDTIGIKLNRYVSDYVYLSGQAHSAFAGGAGAYSIGLIGVGVATRASTKAATNVTTNAANGAAGDAAIDARNPWRVGGELLIGAAGGGGVATASGAIVQGLTWGAWSPSTSTEWRVGVGATRPLRASKIADSGNHISPVFELSWSRAFGMSGR